MGKFSEKFKRETSRIGKQIENVAEKVVEKIEQIETRYELKSEREWASQALAKAEAGLAEINTIITTKTADINTAIESLTTAYARVNAPLALEKLNPLQTQMVIASSLLDNLLAAQKIIVEQTTVARNQREIVSGAPSMANSEQVGKEACAKVQAAAQVITTKLAEIQPDLEAVNAIIAEAAMLIQEAVKLQQEADLALLQQAERERAEEPQAMEEKMTKMQEQITKMQEEMLAMGRETRALEEENMTLRKATEGMPPLTFSSSASSPAPRSSMPPSTPPTYSSGEALSHRP